MNDILKMMLDAEYISRFFPEDEKGYHLSRLVYYFSFFFPDGYKKEKRSRAVRVGEEYWALCGHKLKWMTDPRSRNWRKIRDANSDYNLQQWLSAYPEEDYAWQMVFHSGRVKYEAPQYCIDGCGNSTDTHNTSWLYLCVPVTWFTEHTEQHPIQLYLRWAEILKARHGTSGIGVFPVYDWMKRRRLAGVTHALSQHFPGIEICDFSQSISAGTGLLSPNWLNLLDDEYLETLGGYEYLQNSLQGSHARVHKYDGGVIVSASEYPQLCENGEISTVPEDYRVVSRILKPIRSKNLFGHWGVDTEHSLEWRNRMD